MLVYAKGKAIFLINPPCLIGILVILVWLEVFKVCEKVIAL
jgi:hypothetical protein